MNHRKLIPQKIIILLFMLLSASVLHSQDTLFDNNSGQTASNKKVRSKSFSVFVSFFDHAVAVPFHRIINTPIHPGIMTGIEGKYFETLRSRLFQVLNFGLFYNSYNGTGFFLNTELAYRYTSTFQLSAETLIGLGYLRLYHPVDIYHLNETGVYEKAKDKGFSSPLLSLAMGLGYTVKTSANGSFTPFIRYQLLVQTRNSPDIDVLPHAAIHIGSRFNFRKKHK